MLKTIAALAAAAVLTAAVAGTAAAQGRSECSNNLKQIGLAAEPATTAGGGGLDVLIGNTGGDRAAAGMSCSNNLRQLGLAIHSYSSSHDPLPSSDGPKFKSGGTMSWDNVTNIP